MSSLKGTDAKSGGPPDSGEHPNQRVRIVRSQRGTVTRPVVALFAMLVVSVLSLIALQQIVSAAPVFGDDFETGDSSQWTDSYVEPGNVLEVVAAAARDGNFGLHAQTTGANDDATLHQQIAGTSDVYTRVWMNLQSDVSQGGYQIVQSAATGKFSSHVGALAIRRTSSDANNNLFSWAGGSYSDTGFNLATNTWYCVETRVVVSSSAGRMQVWANETLVADRTGLNTGSTSISWLRLGPDASAEIADYYFDNFDADTAQMGCGVNTPPAAVADSGSTQPGTPVDIDVLANDTDAEGDTLTLVSVTQGSDGTVTINPDDTVRYAPDAGFTGVDTFTYDVSDGSETSTGTVTVFVSAGAPSADNVFASGDEDTVIPWTPSVSGGAGPLTCSITSGPSNGSGSVAVDCSSGTYTPNQDFYGFDSFTYTVDDGTQTEAGRTELTVFEVNDGPVPQDDSVSGLLDTAIDVDVLANDVDVDTTGPALSLAATYNSISVYLAFQNDDNENNSATLEYREAGGAWKPGMSLTVDRRTVVTHASKTYTNTFKDQYRGSILGLNPGTTYDVRVALDDPDGVLGTNPISGSISTRIETAQILSTGNDLFVSKAGSDTTGDGSEANPWLTIQHAANNIAAGDKVSVKAGTYAEKVNITTSGTSDNYVTFTNFGTDTVIIQPPGDPLALGTSGIATDASYLRITGFRIEGGHTGIRIAGDSTQVIVENNVINGVSENGIGIRLGTRLVDPRADDRVNVENITVQNNTIEMTIPQTEDHGGIESTAYNLGGHVIRNNTVEFQYIGDGSHGEDCIFHQENSAYSDSFKDTDIHGNLCNGATDDGIELDGNNVNTRVWDNTIVGANVGFSIGASAVGPTYVFRNVVYDLVYHWSRCLGIKEGRNGSGTVYFYHNTFYVTGAACGTYSPLGDGTGGVIADAAGDASSNIVLKNNIFHAADLGIKIAEIVPDDLVADYNLYFDEDAGVFARYGATEYNSLADFTAATGHEPNGQYGLPSFVNAGAGDFHLNPGSPGEDDGEIIIGFNDPTSAWSYGDAGPDVGAFETGTPTPDPGTYVPTPDLTATPPASPNVTGLGLTIVSFTQGGSGSVGANADGTLRYTPGGGFQGNDSFGYDISDGAAVSSATVDIAVEPYFEDDFESGGIANWHDDLTEPGNTLEVVPEAAFNGNYGLRAHLGGLNDDAHIWQNFDADVRELYTSFRMKLVTDVGEGGYMTFLKVARGVIKPTKPGSMLIRRFSADPENNFYSSAAGDLEDTGFNFATNAWYCVQIRVLTESAPGAEDGLVQKWINGTLVSDRQGLDTGATPIEQIRLGMADAVVTAEVYFDDFKTSAAPIACSVPGTDPDPIEITDIVASPGVLEATITWNTNVPGTTQLEWGMTPALGTFTPKNVLPDLSHSVLITGLSPETTYYFRTISEDQGGTEVSEPVPSGSFITQPRFFDDFETGDISKWLRAQLEPGNTLDIVPEAAIEGNYGLHGQLGGTNDDAYLRGDISDTTELYVKFWTKMLADVSEGGYVTILKVGRNTTQPSKPGALLIRRKPGDLANNLYHSAAGQLQDTGIDLELNRWYCMELRVLAESATGADDGIGQLWLDGYLITDRRGLPTGSGPAEYVRLGFNNSVVTADMYFDDFKTHTQRMGCGAGAPIDIDPPVITSIADSVDGTLATATWTTDEGATSQVEYGTDASLGTFTTLDGSLVTAHTVNIGGLLYDTTYYYRVWSGDQFGNSSVEPNPPGTFVTGPAPPMNTYQVNLSTSTGDPSTEATFTWKTGVSTAQFLRLGTASGVYGLVAQATEYTYPNMIDGTTVCCMQTYQATGLTPNTRHYYQVGSDADGWSEEYSYRTGLSKGDSSPFTFIAYGDQGVLEEGLVRRPRAVSSAVEAADPDLILMAGDITYCNDQACVDEYFGDVIGHIANEAYFMAAPGNHEFYQTDDLVTYTSRVNYPGRAPGDMCTISGLRCVREEVPELWYSFDWGRVHFVSLNLGLDHYKPFSGSQRLQPGEARYDWLDNDLSIASQSPDTDWIVIYAHYSLYNWGKDYGHASDDEARPTLEPLLQQYGVDLWIGAHQHSYERTLPVGNDGLSVDTTACGSAPYSSCTDPQYPTYLTVGTGGRSFYALDTPSCGDAANCTVWSVVKHDDKFGYTSITIDDQTMDIRFTDVDGNLVDQTTITGPRSAPPDVDAPVLSDISVSVATTEATVTWTSDENATSQVEYGLTTALGTFTPLDGAFVTDHSVTLTGLAANTTYFYQAISQDPSTNQAAAPTPAGSFTTAPVGGAQGSLVNLQDSAVYSGSPDNNYGSSSQIHAAKNPSLEFRSLIEWGNLPSQGTTLTSATLTVLVANESMESDDTWEVRFARAAGAVWDEANVTWNTQPAASAPVSISNLTEPVIGSYISFDVKDVVQQAVDAGDTSVTIVMSVEKVTGDTGLDTVSFRSKDVGEALRPTLDITH